MITVYNNLTNIASAHAAAWSVLSRYSGTLPNGKPAPRANGIATQVLLVSFADNKVDSQRRRLPNRGR